MTQPEKEAATQRKGIVMTGGSLVVDGLVVRNMDVAIEVDGCDLDLDGVDIS